MILFVVEFNVRMECEYCYRTFTQVGMPRHLPFCKVYKARHRSAMVPKLPSLMVHNVGMDMKRDNELQDKLQNLEQRMKKGFEHGVSEINKLSGKVDDVSGKVDDVSGRITNLTNACVAAFSCAKKKLHDIRRDVAKNMWPALISKSKPKKRLMIGDLGDITDTAGIENIKKDRRMKIMIAKQRASRDFTLWKRRAICK